MGRDVAGAADHDQRRDRGSKPPGAGQAHSSGKFKAQTGGVLSSVELDALFADRSFSQFADNRQSIVLILAHFDQHHDPRNQDR